MSISFTDELAKPIVEAACRAPSIHNSQPWQLTVEGGELRLYGAPERALSVSDPWARALYISCGAALFNARVAARAVGCDLDVRLLPHPDQPLDVLAAIRSTTGVDPASRESNLYQAIWRRHTNRLPYSSRQIPPELWARLQRVAEAGGAGLRVLDRPQTAAVLALAAEAGRDLAADEAHRDELRRWIAGDPDHRFPAGTLPPRPLHTPSPVRDTDFRGVAPTGRPVSAAYERWPQLAVLTTEHDEPEDWLIAGQALEDVLLVATVNGLAASFLYQVIERDDMRDPRPRSWPWPENAQMIIRLGYPTAEVPVTPRRSTAVSMQPGQGLRIGWAGQQEHHMPRSVG